MKIDLTKQANVLADEAVYFYKNFIYREIDDEDNSEIKLCVKLAINQYQSMKEVCEEYLCKEDLSIAKVKSWYKNPNYLKICEVLGVLGEV